MFNIAGEFGARKLKRDRQKYRWKKRSYKVRKLNLKAKKDPMGGAPMAEGIVLEKRIVEQKQPSSGLIKCVRVRLIKNGKSITAFAPRDGAISHISEHDQVLVAGMGGSQGGAVGSIPGVNHIVIKVNGVSLEAIRTGKKQKVTK